ncbi:MAG: cytochrome c biogenesis protein CcsA [Phycisphaerae bacterium]
MAVKYSILGVLIYAAMAVYLLAFIAGTLRQRKAGRGLFFIAFIMSAGAFIYRWINTGHVPLQNLFEVFIAMGAAVYLLSVICEKYLRINQLQIDTLIGFFVLFPAGFVFSETAKPLAPALQSPFFIPHVAVYLSAYIIMFKAAAAAAKTFSGKTDPLQNEDSVYRLVCLGFPLLALGFILGSIWAHYIWGRYFGFDPKEMWSLATCLVYAGYFHFRFIYGTKYPRINSLWILAGLSLILITLFWANLSKLFAGLHSYAL